MTPADAAQVARLWARALVHGDAAVRTKADALLAGHTRADGGDRALLLRVAVEELQAWGVTWVWVFGERG